jgi:hypothetical protein
MLVVGNAATKARGWAPGPGQKRVLADDRSKVIQLVMLALLLKRVVEIDLEHCPNCGGEPKITAAILEQPVIEKILTHLGLQARAPPRTQARGEALQAA